MHKNIGGGYLPPAPPAKWDGPKAEVKALTKEEARAEFERLATRAAAARADMVLAEKAVAAARPPRVPVMGRKKKAASPIAAYEEKIKEASEILRRAVEGGLLDSLVPTGTSSRWRSWARLRSYNDRLALARLFRGVVEGLGVRVYCDRRRAPHNGIRLSIDVPETDGHPAGRLELFPTSGCPRFWEG